MAATTVLAFLALAFMTQSAPETRPVTLSFHPETPAKAVSVVGDFNRWDGAANPMLAAADGGWTVQLNLSVGAHLFKYRLPSGDQLAPGYPIRKDLGGNTNSVLLVNPSYFDAKPGMKGDGLITTEAIQHRPEPIDTGRVDGKRFWLRLRTRANDLEAVTIHQGNAKGAMRVVNSDGLFDTWQGEMDFGAGDYSFTLRDGANIQTVGPFHQAFDKWPEPKVPSWADGAVYYQIFPERFDNGDKANDGPGTEPWGSKPSFRNRMGGDLRGIINHLDYLKDLGVECLYLNPIFKSGSNHGYDTYDYMLVDPRFGTNEELKELVAKAHARGMKVILDAVFNHSGTQFFAFENLRFHGATSDYKDWYFVLQYPLTVTRGQKTYRTFATTQMMPKLNTDNPATKRYLLNVTRYWMEFADIDGWRLDVADEISQDFWRAFRTEVKGIKKDAVIIGEIWPDAHVWLQGDQHDSVMNYRWREATLGFFHGDTMTPAEFEEKLARVREDYPARTLNNLYNHLDSHDTKRLKFEMKEDQNRADLAIAFQFGYPGAPAIYYGDEVGMDGGGDPDCRRCMLWDETTWDKGLRTLYQQLISLRKSNPALRTGAYTWLSKELPEGVFAFSRKAGDQEIRVYLNRSDKAVQIKDAGRVLVSKGAEAATGSIDLSPYGFAYVQ